MVDIECMFSKVLKYLKSVTYDSPYFTHNFKKNDKKSFFSPAKAA